MCGLYFALVDGYEPFAFLNGHSDTYFVHGLFGLIIGFMLTGKTLFQTIWIAKLIALSPKDR